MINTCLSIIEYAKRCDFVFLRNDALSYIDNSKLTEIKDNSTIYCWSSYLDNLFEYIKNTNLKNITLLSGDNDHCVNPNGCVASFPHENNIGLYVSYPPKNIKKWYAQNAQVVNEFIKPLPIGLSPPWVAQNKIYDIQSLKQKQIVCNKTELVNLNLNTSTNPIQRSEIINIIFKNLGIKNELVDPDLFYEKLQRSKYAICPPGNGKDTHRVWECLYLKTIPIVEDSPMNRYYSVFFPMIVVERWSDITADMLENNYETIIQKFEDNKMLDVDFWFKYHKIGVK
jgi:hypothetical protein